jgi:D-aminoacyl-tRNA deacylase
VPHVTDELLDQRLPASVRSARPTLVFPSIHRSRENVACLTVHPLGNLGSLAELGGRARSVNPTDPRAMASTLRRLSELAAPHGVAATFEATHHGPELSLPSFFAEIGCGTEAAPPSDLLRVLSLTLRELSPDSDDRVALAVGGGHYAPHFTDLALRRRWAFGHILSRHALEGIDRATVRAAFAASADAEGIVYARAADAELPSLIGLGPRLRDGDASRRIGTSEGGPTSAAAPPSGT